MNATSPLSLLVRFLAYAALVAVAFEGIVLGVATRGGTWMMRDDGPVELAQLVVVLSAALLFWLTSRRETRWAELHRLFSALCLVASARELDNWTLQLGWREGYLVLALFPLAWAASVLARAGKGLAVNIGEFARTPAFAMLAVGLFVAAVYSQLIGQKALWLPVLGVDVYRPVKEIVEESSELLGYLLLLFGAVEAAIRDREP